MIDEGLKDLAEHIQESSGGAVLSFSFAKDELVLEADPLRIVDLMRFLHDDRECEFHCLADLCGMDFPAREARFEVVYNLLSLTQNNRVRVKAPLREGQSMPSVISVFKAAGWFEREVWDMFGIGFEGNPDLRRILTDYGFEGHPLRKDFPLTGHVEVRYDEELRRVVYEPVSLNQDFRRFDFESPWEGLTDIQLPGDEKAVKPEHGFRKTTLFEMEQDA